MIIKSVRIHNYKSILDSREFHLEKEVTIFIGKNESGKTNVLKAIRDINNLEDNQVNYPNHLTEYKSKIILKVVLSETEIESINEKLEVDAVDSSDINIIIESGNKKTVIIPNNILEILKNKHQTSFEEKNNVKTTLNFDNFDETLFSEDDDKSKLLSLEYKLKLSTYAADVEFIKKSVINNLPKIVYLSQIENNLPKTITADNITSDAVKNLINFVSKQTNNSIDKETFKKLTMSSISYLEKNIICDDISNVLTQFFAKYYNQYKLKFDLSPNGNTVDIFIRDYFINKDGKDSMGAGLYLEERSKGFNWFVSFVITCHSFTSNEIFVLDEPGMDLHLKGQQDMFEVLKHISKERQIMLCTHSPYLIDTNCLPIVRLVEKKSTMLGRTSFDETIVCQNLHSYSDKDTVLTLLDAIGYDITKGLTYHKQQAIIVEGISDLLLLKAFYKVAQKDIDFDIFFAKTTSKMDMVYSIIFGLGIKKIVVLYDADKAGLSTYRDMVYVNEYSLFTHPISEDILSGKKSLSKEFSIEDIFSKADFKKYYLLENEKFYDDKKTNAQIAKEKNSKFLDSKILLDNVEQYSFDEETRTNINRLISNIEEKFNLYL